MNRSDLNWAVSLIVGLILGFGSAYTNFTAKDAVTEKAVDQLEVSSQQHQKELNILRVSMREVQTEVKNTDQSYKVLSETLKEVAESTKDVAIALARLEERQAKTDKILESISEKIKVSLRR